MKQFKWLNRIFGVSLWLVAFAGIVVTGLHVYQFAELISEADTQTETPLVRNMGNLWLSVGHTYHKKGGAELCNQYYLALPGLRLVAPTAGPPVPYVAVHAGGVKQTLKQPDFGIAPFELPVSAQAVYILGLLVAASSAIALGVMALVLWFLRGVLKNVGQGQYFSADNKQKLTAIGGLFIAIPVAEWVFRLLIFIAFVQDRMNMELPEGWGIIREFSGEFQALVLIPGFAIVALARIFEAGSSLEEEAKLTI